MSVTELVIRICIVLIGSTFAAIIGITLVGNGSSTNGATVMQGDALTMTCSMSQNISSVTWMKTEASLNAKEESHVLMRLMNDGKCDFFKNTPPTDVDCSCISPRVFSCTIKHTTDVDNEDIWRCWASGNGRNMSSNEIHIYVHGNRTSISANQSVEVNGISTGKSVTRNVVSYDQSMEVNGISVGKSVTRNGVSYDQSVEVNGISTDQSVTRKGVISDQSVTANDNSSDQSSNVVYVAVGGSIVLGLVFGLIVGILVTRYVLRRRHKNAANSFEDKTRLSKDAPLENMYITVLPQKEGSEQNSSANVGHVRRPNTHHNEQPLHLSSSTKKTYADMNLRTEGCTTKLDNIHKRQKHVNLSPSSPPCSTYELLSPELRRHAVYDCIKPEQYSL
ncbi:uncharacterized protein LOC127880770 isoform X3 [Dreissena polymorpha]|uniref:uncharacterized protein LOC127880770 isoform X3 n=1 Tax=Dreissena polymorpha TaxID=45954 RepID=UPI002264A4B2|nr:uncharacterized protein LOC127880770 isoform X3 [Dreissena polymorpha]